MGAAAGVVLLSLIAAFPLHSAEGSGKWVPLFNGRNLDSWRVLNGTAEYRVENGEIVGVSKSGTPNTFLVTNTVYTNFVLEFDIKMDEGLNSGVQFRSNSIESYEKGRVHGLQVECEDSKRAWAGGIYDEGRKGWRYPLEYNPAAKTAYKKGVWNTFRVAAFENRVMVWVNGVHIVNLMEDAVEAGFFGLQVHAIGKNDALAGKQVRWRNIRMKPATAGDVAVPGKRTAPEVSYLHNVLTEKEKADGWKLLWDGATSKGWRGAKLAGFPTQGWLIKDGMLQVQAANGGEATNGGDIVTEKKYKDFILEADFSFTRGANSGIKYFVDTELNKGAGSSIGCEFQILDDDVHADAKLGVKGNRTMGSLYDLITANGREYHPDLPRDKYVNGYGQWNRARIVVRGGTVQHFLNGIKIVEYTRQTQMWRALVAYSKYRDWPNFGDAEYGNILLQDHGSDVQFRSIKIKEL